MGIARPKSLFDLIKFEANLRVTCPDCGRSGVYPAKDVLAYFRAKGWNTAWEIAGIHFKCDGMAEGEGCGRRGAILSMAAIPRPPVFPKPEPTELDLRKEAERRR
jgi:hypothetical protein